MKKLLIIAVTSALLVALGGATIASAMPYSEGEGLKGMFGQAGNSNNGFIELWEKDFEDPEWPIITDGAWGKLKYSIAGDVFHFHFNGHGLEPGYEYALIYYPDPWPGTGLIIFGSGFANGGGNIHIMGIAEVDYLPSDNDENDGAKIWLVLLSIG